MSQVVENSSKPKLNFEIENKKRSDAAKEALTELLEKYKTEEVSEEERIIDYTYTGYGVGIVEDETKEFKCSISFIVTPYLDNGSIWQKGSQICFAQFDRIDGELILRNISLTPENYEEFLEAFEEYQNNKSNTDEMIVVPNNVKNNINVNSSKIDELGDYIFIGSAIVLLVVVSCFIISKIKKKK